MIPKTVKIKQYNITQMDKNGHVLLEDDADITGVAEHKLTAELAQVWKDKFGEAGMKFMPSPANFERKNPTGGSRHCV